MTIEEIIRQRTREVTDTGKYHSREIFTRDSTLRKIKAAEYFAPVLKEKFGEKYPSLDWDETAAELSVLGDTGPDEVNRDTRFLNAVAIFILDSLAYGEDGAENYQEVKRLLRNGKYIDRIEDDVFEFFETYFYIDVNHPQHSNDLITELMKLITFRNMEYVDYSREKSGLGNYAFVCDSYTTGLTKPHKNGTDEGVRERYEKIVSSVGEEFIEDAVQAYRKLFLELIDCYLDSREKTEKHDRKLDGQYEWLEMQMKEESTKIVENGAVDHEANQTLLARMSELDDKSRLLHYTKINMKDFFMSGFYSSPKYLDRYTGSFSRVVVPDPYKVIAGFFFLLEKGDDWAWLTGPSTAALGFASCLLPWVDTDWEEEKEDAYLDTIAGSYSLNENYHRPYIYPEKIDFTENEESVVLSPAKFLYCLSYGVVPRYSVRMPYRDKLGAYMSEDEIRELELMYLYTYRAPNSEYRNTGFDFLSFWKDNRKRLEELEKELEETKENLSRAREGRKELESRQTPNEKLEAENRSLSVETERLGSLVAEKDRELQNERKEKARLIRKHRNEEEELYSLRELIFSTRNEESVETKEISSRSWPYRTKTNVVLVGGHEDWINRMKTLLPDVRFYGDRVPPKEVLKNTDVLWIQTRFSLSHSTYYKLVDQAKNLALPIRYIPWSGTYSSAEAVAALDEKSDR